ncbi:filament-like plant protein 3 [Actinidia eriantha]|uniref:filament-like plant protein 3 n=1 Tax=Actinidia eriantha TaxID=165200 RepID=UPI0025912624|nr:filament-like plant protein 3 [Actinidia eriantha]XP_057499962.1 filament-like plant protein 3 [Actinidia eriantha]XP_057499963.1 filament-like plant protein 3 [Actinidia eriantha]XP_057499964.1 filament-like plant protein 3 [Actinidia eriantha]XP_057499965.1 filament-like plant protein 3 [Actinidia eriantha]XP_057499966.1 filament-like plant protein 3 [Actinidia eriantha]XP_057499967.1 filament-like plant protein 3 [Actinidia eriantha]
MDRRSWLWRRKSSEKSPGETESSGSLSSHSERFFDDQACSDQRTQSPEVTSKSAPRDEELNESVKTLTEKLSAALLNIKAKDDLVKQHAKVAEEAVSGWEKAESEVLALKQQLEAAAQKNTSLEDRVGHLDGALKECVRQLRQAREEQEQKIFEALSKKTREWEFTKSELESHLAELQSQIESTKDESDPDLRPKLDAVEKENSALKLELLSRVEELEISIIERDLSTQAAETASKQHLESIKKVAKLEAECRRLKAMARKASTANDYRSVTASSVYVESFTDSQSDNGERLLVVENDSRKISGPEPNECEPSHSDSWASALIAELDQFKNENALGRNLVAPSVEINLMDDFLEMERLAALPETESRSYCLPESGALLDQSHDGETPSKAEFEAMLIRAAELEEKLKKMEMEKSELEMALTECQDQLKKSRDRLMDAEVKLVELQTLFSMENEARSAADAKLQASNAKRELTESQLLVLQGEKSELEMALTECQDQLKKSRDRLVDAQVKLVELQTWFATENEARIEADAELAASNAKSELAESQLLVLQGEKSELEMALTECQYQLKKSRDRLVDAEGKLVELQTLFAKEKEAGSAADAELEASNAKRELVESQLLVLQGEKSELEMALTECQDQLKKSRDRLVDAEVKLVELQTWFATENEARIAVDAELAASNAKSELAESQLLVLQGEIKTLLSKVGSLEEEVRKEQALSREAATNCRKLEDDILRMKHEVEIPNAEILKEALKIKQDKELAVASSKLAECQKTIASLGRQLKSLATLEDFLIDSEKSSELPKDGSQFPDDSLESRKPHSGDLYLPKWYSESPRKIVDFAGSLENSRNRRR